VNSSLLNGTGPTRFRSQLRHATRPLSTLLTAISSSSATVRVKLPATIFGGDILSFMSRQLTELLEVAPVSEPVVVNRSRPTRQSSMPDNTRDVSRAGLTDLVTSLHKPHSFPEQLESFASRREFASTPAVPETAGVSFLTSVAGDSQSRSSFASLPNIAHEGFQFVSEPGGPQARRNQNGNGESALLEKKLRQYWQLAQEERNHQQSFNQANATEVSSQPAVPVVTESSVDAFNSRSWHGALGREISRKARLASAQLPGPTANNMSQRSTEKVEIQNVFNIEVKNQTDSTRGFDDLADRIAEILNEQALQHGIDVT
jgi:hypothetical protein